VAEGAVDDAVALGRYERSAFSSSSLPPVTIGRISTWSLVNGIFFAQASASSRLSTSMI
jgi:hypothetical protein